jgi:hypothetical protein
MEITADIFARMDEDGSTLILNRYPGQSQAERDRQMDLAKRNGFAGTDPNLRHGGDGPQYLRTQRRTCGG